MQYTVLLHSYPTGNYEAFAPVPACVGKGRTRTEALAQLKNMLQEWMDRTEITEIDVELPGSEYDRSNPWLETAGIFKDDPVLETMLSEIYSLRDADGLLE